MSRLGCCSASRAALVLLVSTRCAAGALLLDFTPTDLGQNSTHQPTNYSVWRWSTTGGHNATMVLSNGSRGTSRLWSTMACCCVSRGPWRGMLPRTSC